MCAYASITATSSALALRTCCPPSPAATAAASAVTWPNAPKRTFAIDRFIARPIISVSKVPDAPTSMPATIRTLFWSSKPPAATARPVKAFSSEITTGMSAPPIGRTKRTPKSSDAPISTQSSHSSWTPETSASPQPTARRKTAPLTNCCPGYVIGRPPISSCSFANAIIEPANEIEPISAESMIASEMSIFGDPASGRMTCTSASAISAAAPPPTPLNSATICGIAVIFTLRAATAPKPPPISIPIAIAHQLVVPMSIHVTTTASTMPTAPIWLPRRACAGSDRNFSARMKLAIVIR